MVLALSVIVSFSADLRVPVLSGPSAERAEPQEEVHSALVGQQRPRPLSLLAARASWQTVDTQKKSQEEQTAVVISFI